MGVVIITIIEKPKELNITCETIDFNESSLYFYSAVVDVYEGATIIVNIDLGFNTWLHKEKLRLSG